MKRTKLLALTLVVAIMMMGAGYAYWSDQLVVNSTVATGNLNVRFYSGSISSIEDAPTSYVLGTVPALVDSRDQKSISWDISNLYPGAKLNLNVVIENNGSIPAVMEEFIITEDNWKSSNFIAPEKFLIKTGSTITKGEKAIFTVDDTHNINLGNFDNIMTELLKFGRMEPNETISFNLIIEMDTALDGNMGENSSLEQTMTMNFMQHNEGTTPVGKE